MILKEKMKFTILFQSCLVLFFLIQVMYACGPAEEGKPYTLTHVMTKAPSDTTMLMWTKDDNLIAECALVSGDCTTNDINWLTANVNTNGEMWQFSINIMSVSREILKNTKGLWKLQTHTSSPNVEVFYECNLQVYAKPTETKCTKTWSKDGLTVSCYGKQVYPEAMMAVFRESIDTQTVLCNNTHSNLEPLYYETECWKTLKKHDLLFERDDYIFCLYPSLIGHPNFTQTGTNISLSLLKEYSSVSVQDCNKSNGFINCSCERLDSDESKSGFNWIADGVDVKSKTQYYVTIVNGTAVNDITCTPIVTGKNQKEDTECTDTGNITVIVLAVLFAISGLINVVLCYTFIKKYFPLLKLTKVNLSSARTYSKGIEFTEDEESRKLFESKTEESTRNTGTIEDISAPISASKSDANNHKRSILLVGTKESNKELYKRTLLQKSYAIEKQKSAKKKIWKVLDKETNEEIHETSQDEIKLPDKNILHLHYFERCNIVFKLIDGPVYDDQDVDKFIEEMKSCLVLCREGYNTVVVVYTSDTKKDARSLVFMLHEDLGIDLNNVIVVKSIDAKYKKYVAPKEINIHATIIKEDETKCENTDATQLRDISESTLNPKKQEDITQTKEDVSFKKWFGKRYIQFNILPAYVDNTNFFSLVCEMGKAISVPFFIDNPKSFVANNMLENV
ncbi:uncharacterized protein LOC131939399 [Physella acuta]|uniref:uncharacterized protein LOC131939399 n=1 Tax=Physella acuta TaxID=109671 RepID=UPI0027DE87DE|nr:uncharacterized protein LOC131939399 [Physella acuta]